MKLDTTTATIIRKRHKLAESIDVRSVTAGLEVKEAASDPYKFTARITTDALDRQDEVVVPEGGQFGEFLSSGAIFWNHDYNQPVGYPDKDKRIIRGANFVEAGGVFMQRPAGYQGDFFPDFVREFVTQGIKAGIFPGVSIGFVPIESRRPSKQDVTKYGSQVQLVHSKWKLLEFSIAPVQANQEAVVIAIGKGLLRRETAKAIGFAVPDTAASVPSLPPVASPRKVIKCSMVIPELPKEVDYRAIAEKEFHKAVYKSFGRLRV